MYLILYVDDKLLAYTYIRQIEILKWQLHDEFDKNTLVL